MHERDEILVMLLVAGFFASSFWPVLCGWVDLLTLAGWLTLLASYATLMAACTVLGLIITVGTLLIAVPGFVYRCITDRASAERRVIVYAAGRLKIVLHHSFLKIWQITWWLALLIRRRVNTAG